MMLRVPLTFLLLLAVSSVYGDALTVNYLGQSPENVVLEGVPITYSFHNILVDDDPRDDLKIGTGMQISIDGIVIAADSTEFSSDGCVVDDPPYTDFWACDDLHSGYGGQVYSFTWTPRTTGTYVMDFYGVCQPLPPTDPPGDCDVNEGVPTVAYFETIVGTDTDGDGNPDATDPDDDNDGIPDDLDEFPLVPSNNCTGGDFDNATLGVAVVDDLTCAARISIYVEGVTEVMAFPAHLRLIAPSVLFEDGFDVLAGGSLTVISANPCPDCGGYEIGDEGPAGGIVFYVTDGGWHGLEAAPVDQSIGTPWGCHGTDIAGANGYLPGTGAQNTAAILEQCADRPIAASVAHDYSLNGFDGWFLPSIGELFVAYFYLHSVDLGGFVDSLYWSSTGVLPNGAMALDFGIGTGSEAYNKNNAYRVRAIREF